MFSIIEYRSEKVECVIWRNINNKSVILTGRTRLERSFFFRKIVSCLWLYCCLCNFSFLLSLFMLVLSFKFFFNNLYTCCYTPDGLRTPETLQSYSILFSVHTWKRMMMDSFIMTAVLIYWEWTWCKCKLPAKDIINDMNSYPFS